MCLLVALDVLQKKYENSCFLKFNLLQKGVGGWMQMQKFALLFAVCEENYNTVVAVDSGHKTSKTAGSKCVILLQLD